MITRSKSENHVYECDHNGAKFIVEVPISGNFLKFKTVGDFTITTEENDLDFLIEQLQEYRKQLS